MLREQRRLIEKMLHNGEIIDLDANKLLAQVNDKLRDLYRGNPPEEVIREVTHRARSIGARTMSVATMGLVNVPHSPRGGRQPTPVHRGSRGKSVGMIPKLFIYLRRASRLGRRSSSVAPNACRRASAPVARQHHMHMHDVGISAVAAVSIQHAPDLATAKRGTPEHAYAPAAVPSLPDEQDGSPVPEASVEPVRSRDQIPLTPRPEPEGEPEGGQAD